MTKKLYLYAVLPALFFAGNVRAQEFPMVNLVADQVIARYQNSSCEQLWQKKMGPKSAEAQNLINILKENPQMRIAFVNRVAAPVINKMFECGMVP